MNFIEIDNFITTFLLKNIETYNNSIERMKIYSNVDLERIGGRIHNDIVNDLKIIDELKFSENILNLYKTKTNSIIKNFIKILKTPIQNNNLKQLEEAEKQKKHLSNLYLYTIKICIPYEILQKLLILEETILNVNYCDNCENTEEFIKDNDILICKVCFSEIIKMAYYNNRSFNYNGSIKCNYDRLSHFKECLKQYQGKQNTYINPKVYENIKIALLNNGIIKNYNEIPTKVNKTHIIYFLKELGYTKHYDDYILIHYNLTGIKPDDISHIEDKLTNDFIKISEKYMELFNKKRKNFIFMKFFLYILLIKHEYKFNEEDFQSVKSTEKKTERDKICKEIFNSLGWAFKI